MALLKTIPELKQKQSQNLLDSAFLLFSWVFFFFLIFGISCVAAYHLRSVCKELRTVLNRIISVILIFSYGTIEQEWVIHYFIFPCLLKKVRVFIMFKSNSNLLSR